MEFQYNYTRAGDVLSINDQIRNIYATYEYDDLHRLTKESVVGPFVLGNGNDIYEMYYEGPKIHAPNRIVKNDQNRIFSYSENGNLEFGNDLRYSSPDTRTITYNVENMPVSLSYEPYNQPVVSTAFTYDGNGKRIKKQTGPSSVQYLDDIMEIRNGQAVRFIFAGGLRLVKVKGTSFEFFHKDHLGSSAVTSDINGSKIESLSYEPFGSDRKLLCTPEQSDLAYTFTDQEWDKETGLYNYDARLYDPVVGQFTMADTLLPDVYDPQGLNRYAYTRNNPLKYTDPDGHDYVLANRRWGAVWQGHNGHLIGNDIDGWNYYSKNNYGDYNHSLPYPTLDRFKKDNKNGEVKGGVYDRFARIVTSRKQDAMMKNAAENKIDLKYQIIGIKKNDEGELKKQNCAQLGNSIIKAGKIFGDKSMVGIRVIPNDQYSDVHKHKSSPKAIRMNEQKIASERTKLYENKKKRRKH